MVGSLKLVGEGKWRPPDLAAALAQELQPLAAVGTVMDITDALATWMNVAVPALSLGKNGKHL